jgi:hypothetical protein
LLKLIAQLHVEKLALLFYLRALPPTITVPIRSVSIDDNEVRLLPGVSELPCGRAGRALAPNVRTL